MTDYSFTLDGTTGQNSFRVFGDNAPSTVTVTLTEDAGTTFTLYEFFGRGSNGYAAYADTFNLILPVGWTAQYNYINDDYGGTFGWAIYNDSNVYGLLVAIEGGDAGTVSNVCFTAGTLIDTPKGPRAVEMLRAGDMVLTRDGGPKPLRWSGATTVSGETLAAFPHLRPIRIAAGALGDHGEILVSPQHRMLLTGWRAAAVYGAEEVLVAARDLVDGTAATVAEDVEAVTYCHLLFDGHEIVCANGAWSESFHPAALTQGTVNAATRDEVLTLFPALEQGAAATARRTLTAADVAVLTAEP